MKEELNEKYGVVQAEIEKQIESLTKLKKQIKEQFAQKNTPPVNKNMMLDAIAMINEKKNTNVLDTKRYQILKDDLDMCLKVLTEEIQKL